MRPSERNQRRHSLNATWKRAVGFAGRLLQMLWEYRLGWIVGHSLLVVTHVGRHTGKHYRTVLYVQRYDSSTREATVISVWGESHWFRNITARPAIKVDIGLQRYIPAQRFLNTEQIFEIETRFRRRHKIIAWGQARLMGWQWPASDTQLREQSAGMRGVAFSPTPLPLASASNAETDAYDSDASRSRRRA